MFLYQPVSGLGFEPVGTLRLSANVTVGINFLTECIGTECLPGWGGMRMRFPHLAEDENIPRSRLRRTSRRLKTRPAAAT